jgi:hypothetical protein
MYSAKRAEQLKFQRTAPCRKCKHSAITSTGYLYCTKHLMLDCAGSSNRVGFEKG